MPLQRGPGGKLGVAAVMPRQVRQGSGNTRVQLSTSHTINIFGNGDAELHAQWREGTRQALEERDRQWETRLPDLIEAHYSDPDGRIRYSA
jgi:hypothetical protein